jgi:hypothetical protein
MRNDIAKLIPQSPLLVALILSLLSATQLFSATPAMAEEPLAEITVWHSPTCGCCTKWIDHLKEYGFPVRSHAQHDVAMIKHRLGLPDKLASCHTAMVNGYVIEGHVPAEDIERLLKERPFVRGLSVPGMPTGSPGMEMGDRVDPYEVLSFDEDGKTAVFSRHP